MPQRYSGGRVGRKPIEHRYWLVLFLLVCPLPADGSADALLTEADAVRRGLARPALDDLSTAEVELARSEAVRAGLIPNPVAAYGREQTFGGDDASAEDYAWLLQRFDLSGRRGLRVEAAQQRVEATEAEVRGRRLAGAAAIRLRFYDVLQRQQRVAALQQWSVRLAAVAARIGRRAAAGDAAAYDRLRAEREQAGAGASTALEEAGLARAREALAALIGDAAPSPGTPAVAGDLLPPAPLPDLEDALARLPGRPDLRALEAQVAAAELLGRASARWWLPEIEIGAGLKHVEMADERLNGFIANAAIPLPLLSRDQDEVQRAAAEAQAAHSRRRLELGEAIGQVRGVHAEASQLAAAARRARADDAARWPALVGAAEAAYHGGEGGILELVDAYRVDLEAQLQTLDLEWRARRAQLELDRLMGVDP